MEELNYEQKVLDNKRVLYKEAMEDTLLYLNTIPIKYIDNPMFVDRLLKLYGNKYRLMQVGILKPYFARIDFKGKNSLKNEVCYIGKVGVSDTNNNIITVDWRAPISTLYYDSNLGSTTYYSPEGIIEGNLITKRQIDIEDGKVIRINDVDSVSNDEILKPYLGVTNDSRLKNIVSTIQKEQNEIIRSNVEDNIIVQGVAGSGKTTVALHKLAYLVYTYKDVIQESSYMVIGPNKFFMNYISNVLPDLDVCNVKENTYEDLLLEYLSENITFKKTSDKEEARFKNSKEYINLIDEYMEVFSNNILPKDSFYIKNIKIINIETVNMLYNSIDVSLFKSIKSRLDRLCLLIETHIKNDVECKNRILLEIMNVNKTDREYIRKNLINNFKTDIKKYINKSISSSIKTIYKTFLSYNNLDTNLTTNDITGLMYIKYLIVGNNNYNVYRHIVIDEAQDYGYFNFYILTTLFTNSTFSIYGDMAQSIYGYKSITNWDDIYSLFKNVQVKYLLKSYRSTIEIMSEANQILRHIGLKESVPVIRHGEDVRYKEYKTVCDILDFINEYKNEGYDSIALICKNDDEVNKIYKELKAKNIELNIISDKTNLYNGKVSIMSSNYSKGLEFDAVLIIDASDKNYNIYDIYDMKLLYVSMTRALHRLDVLYTNNLTKVLVK